MIDPLPPTSLISLYFNGSFNGSVNGIIAGNLVALLVYPVVWWQVRLTKSKSGYLFANMIGCIIFAISFYLSGVYAAAIISMISGLSSIIQIYLEKRHLFVRWLSAIASILVVYLISGSGDLIGYLALFGYAWVRFAEIFKENSMRVMLFVSPFIWILVALLSHTYTMIPVDIFFAVLMFQWIVLRLPNQSASKESVAIAVDLKARVKPA